MSVDGIGGGGDGVGGVVKGDVLIEWKIIIDMTWFKWLYWLY